VGEEKDANLRFDENVIASAVAVIFVGILYVFFYFEVPILQYVSFALLIPGLVVSGVQVALLSQDPNTYEVLMIFSFILNAVFWSWVLIKLKNYRGRRNSLGPGK
jgi:predicted permease